MLLNRGIEWMPNHKNLKIAFGLSGLLFSAVAHASEPAPSAPTPDTLSGNWGAVTNLNAVGIHPFATYTAEVWGNVAGGLKTGWWYNHLLDFGIEADTEKMGGWSGGTFVAQFHWVQNRRNNATFADYTGASNPVSGIIANDHFRVYNLYYGQSWKEDAVSMKVGQLAADDDFMLSDYASLFANSTLGAMPSQVDMPCFPIYPVAAPGVFLRVHPTEPLYLQAGIYYGNPGADENSNHGFDWGNESDPSVAAFYEAGYKYKIAEHAATTRLGGTYHSGDADDFHAINRGSVGATSSGAYSFYAIQDMVLASRSNGDPLLAMFVRGGIKPEFHSSIVAGYWDAGLNWFGPIPGRPDDVAGVAVANTLFGSDYRKSTGPNGAATSETTLAFAYKAQVTKWFSLQADVQVLFNPAVSPESGKRETATVLGLRGQITF